MELKAKYIPSNALDLVKYKCKELSLKNGEHVMKYNKHFCRLRSKFNPHQPMEAKMIADSYGYEIEKGKPGCL